MAANMVDRLHGSRGHEIVVYIRTGMTVALWALAAIGCLGRLSRGHRDFTFALLAVAPFPLVAAQSYGGEMLLRVYLFSLPFMAFFAAAVFYRSEEVGASWATTAAIMLVSVMALGLFFVTRYGNERQDYFTPSEAAAAEYLYDRAPPGSVFLAGTVKAPWKYRDYGHHRHITLADNVEWDPSDYVEPELDKIRDVKIRDVLMDSRYVGGYLFITRSQIANDELFGLVPTGLTEVEQRVRDSSMFVLIYENEDARIYVLTESLLGGPPCTTAGNPSPC